jgi:transposase
MPITVEVRQQLVARFEVLLPHLNERQQRLALAAEARLLGHGGVRAVARVAGVSETTVRKGVFELERGEDPLPAGRVRRAGGGRKRAALLDPRLLPALLGLVEPDERGDPMSPLRWTTKSLRHLAEELTRQGHVVSAPTVGKLLRENGFSLQANAKTLEGDQHPDRDAQFRYINEQVKDHQGAGEPVISVDTKKKEHLGRLPNAGREWRPAGEPVEVEDHSFFFTGPDVEQAIPYGIYDITADTGWVNVGVDHDTSAFAVASIRRWWQARGTHDYPSASRLLITADAGGSNSYRYRLWKAELAALAAETGLDITVCHFPPGTSKWNKVEHRLFSHITLNWRGRPLTSHEVVVQTIASTRTSTGLRVAAELDTGIYPLGVSVSKADMQALPLAPHTWCGSWNYTIGVAANSPHQRPPDQQESSRVGVDSSGRAQIRDRALEVLSDPRLTGISRHELDMLTADLAPAQAAQTAQRRYEQRGGRRRRAPGAGSRSLLSDAARVLITVIYLRQTCSQNVLSEILGVNPNSIGQAIAETRQLLDERGHTISPTTLRFTTPKALTDFLDGAAIARRPSLPEALSVPTLTGMPRPELDAMIERLSIQQAAQVERRRYRRRGAERLPGARGGVFLQKITDPERILATVLYQRRVCTRQALAELFGVSTRTIGTALNEVRPLLEQDGYVPTPASGPRFATAAALLASLPTTETPDAQESPC